MACDNEGLRVLVQQYCKMNDKLNLFSNNGLPSYDCVNAFRKRWNDVINKRKPQSISPLRARAISKEIHNHFYEILHEKLVVLDLMDKPSNIYNCDEIGFQCARGNRKVFARKGETPHVIGRNNEKQMYTFNVCANANGNYLNPYVIYKAKHLRAEWTTDGPGSCLYNTSQDGWMGEDQFYDWFLRVFVAGTQNQDGDKILLYDDHSSHISIRVIQLAMQNNICIICLPAHTSHIYQPMDLCVIKALKSTWYTLV
jgi:hypothetical protein